MEEEEEQTHHGVPLTATINDDDPEPEDFSTLLLGNRCSERNRRKCRRRWCLCRKLPLALGCCPSQRIEDEEGQHKSRGTAKPGWMMFLLGFCLGISFCLFLSLVVFRWEFGHFLQQNLGNGFVYEDMGGMGDIRRNEVAADFTTSTTVAETNAAVFKWPSDIVEEGRLNCALILDPDLDSTTKEVYLKEVSGERRITLKEEDFDREHHLAMSCEAIRGRNHFSEEAMCDEEREFPLAYARIVYRVGSVGQDYRFLEMEFAAAYAPQNVFCYAIDEKAPHIFHERIGALAKCFPANVFVTKHEYRVDSAGHNVGYSLLECFRVLAQADANWKYVFTLQVRTNQELVQILKWLNGANDIEVYKAPDSRFDSSKNWTLDSLNIFRDSSLSQNNNHTLQLAKGLVESSVSRPAIDFMLRQLNLTGMMLQLETDKYGIDELWLASLQATDELQMPGGFTRECLKRGVSTPAVTRYTMWYDSNKCGSGHMRHSLCVFGVEDLAKKLLAIPHMFINKFMPEVDFGASICVHQAMFNRTYLRRGVEGLRPEIYQSLPHARFQMEKNEDHSQFNCSYTAYNLIHAK